MIDISLLLASLETEEQKITAEYIYINYRNAMYRYASEILPEKSDAEDAVMHSMEKICRNINAFIRLPENERKLLVRRYTINTALDLYRKNKRETNSKTETVLTIYFGEEKTENVETISCEDSLFTENTDFGSMQKYIRKLPKSVQEVLFMKYIDGMRNTEIAETLGMNISTVNSRISNAQKKLRKMYENDRKRGDGE